MLLSCCLDDAAAIDLISSSPADQIYNTYLQRQQHPEPQHTVRQREREREGEGVRLFREEMNEPTKQYK